MVFFFPLPANTNSRNRSFIVDAYPSRVDTLTRKRDHNFSLSLSLANYAFYLGFYVVFMVALPRVIIFIGFLRLLTSNSYLPRMFYL